MSDYGPLRLVENGHSSSSQPRESRAGSNRNHSNDVRVHNPDGRDPRHDHQHRRDNGPNRIRSQSESSTKSGHLRYGAKNVIELFVPVSLCMIIVVGTMKATDSYQYSSQSVNWYGQMMFSDQSVDTGTRVWQSFANALMMLMCIIVMTTLLIFLYKFRCYKTIHVWLILSSLMLLFMFALMYVAEILRSHNIPMDNYSLTIFIWNFGVVGMLCIHWKGPLILQQGYLIAISALMTLVLIRSLPDWTAWTVLAIVSVWDLVAVLCPRGPLRILVETAQERNESIFPALIYSSTMVWEIGSGIFSVVSMADSTPRPSSKTVVKRSQHPVEIHYEDSADPPKVAFVQPIIDSPDIDHGFHRPVVRALSTHSGIREVPKQSTVNYQAPHDQPVGRIHVEEEEHGVKLGLGDFIFFSVLVGKASSYGDWNVTIACYVAILVGLCLTLSLLAIFRKALPALPISIAFGLCSFFLSYVFVVPFAEKLAFNQVFI